MKLPQSLNNLIEHFEALPGIGTKTAERLAFYFLKANGEEAKSFAKSLVEVKENLSLCNICGNVAEGELCEVCMEEGRKENVICVVENVLNLIALEKTGFDGVYHVLHGVLNPINGVNPEDLNLNSLFTRLESLKDAESNAEERGSSSQKPSFEGGVIELIIATNPTMEGESTAMYIKRKISQEGFENVKITRIGRGIPTGGDIEFADKSTLDNALQSRKDF